MSTAYYIYGISLGYLAGLAIWCLLGWGLLVLLLRLRRRFHGKTASPLPPGVPRRDLPHMGRLWLVNFGLSLWMMLATLTAVEIYLAFFYNQTDSFNMTLGCKTWYRRHVQFRQLNNEQFRDVEPLLADPPRDRQRIWFMGDSFTFGHGVTRREDRFSDIVASHLEKKHPGKFLVNNLAEAGSNATQVRGLMDVFWNKGFPPPDMVVFTLCLNDVEPYLGDSGKRYAKMGEWAPPSAIFDHSYLLNFLWFRLKQSRQPAVQNYFGDVVEAWAGGPGGKVLRELDYIQYTCRARKVKLRVVIFPFLHNLGEKYPFAAAHKLVADHCRKQNIPVLDLHPVLEPHAAEGLAVNRFDAHPNERAHALAARAIEDSLLQDVFASGKIESATESK